MSNLTPFLLAVQFLTRIPVPASTPYSEEDQARSLLYYPLVGLLIGSVLWILPLPQGTVALNAAFLVALWVVITGGLHLDGLADTADAWVGGQGDADRTLAIMKDPASGPMGVTAIVLVLLLKVTAVYELEVGGLLGALLLPPLLGRTAVLVLVTTTPYVRSGGLGAVIAQQMHRGFALKVVGLTVLGVGLIRGIEGVLLAAFLGVFILMLRKLLIDRMGGITGDTLGAGVEMVETATLLFLVWNYAG